MDPSPFHPDELAAQARAGALSRGAGIRDAMPDQHRGFFGQLPILFASVADAGGHPLATLVSGEPGFVQSPTPTTLSVRALPPQSDPAAVHLQPDRPIGLLGLEFPSRRRNRANGVVTTRDAGGFSVSVRQSFGNCAKYIQARTPVPIAGRNTETVEMLGALDEGARSQIAAADTFFLASQSADPAHGGLDMSHRGGRPGFVAIDGDTLLVPDFAGNNYFNSFGNLLSDPRAGLLFVDFADGSLLQLQGTAQIIWDGETLSHVVGAERLLRIAITAGWRRRGALPFAWSPVEPAATTLQTGVWDTDAMA
ncbi:pyridoxamine 5'-phosphate oxidase family protein [Bosea sp. PAMC 26642]|uniref:pyridoxamine 5'-phosphate oxidase family protein n=1 Tax=Bosea sp. (strain PAMC 26642) TaxID=1792307 RepID=UPI0007703ACE|nr:pyridoxamine 5'-phosphate oxidase family protein [Bosea sp. PAMC 26642]AMJ60840.1 pyridoxamine 5'-phosphate oxidase [Bosea sp. PAMC 26642]